PPPSRPTSSRDARGAYDLLLAVAITILSLRLCASAPRHRRGTISCGSANLSHAPEEGSGRADVPQVDRGWCDLPREGAISRPPKTCRRVREVRHEARGPSRVAREPERVPA